MKECTLNRLALFLMIILMMSTHVRPQKRSSQEMGGGFSFWSITEKDTAESYINLNGLWSYYMTNDFLFEIEPHASVRFSQEQVDLTGLLFGGVSKRLVDVSSVDRRSSSAWDRRHERTTAGIYGSLGGGIWAERAEEVEDERIYFGPAFAVGLGTHSALGSLTKLRTKFQFVYLMPTPPLYDEPRTMFTFTVGFSVVTKL